MRFIFILFILATANFVGGCKSHSEEKNVEKKDRCEVIDCDMLKAILENDLDDSKYTNITYTEVLKISKRKGKPILFYFTGHACVNCRKAESFLFSQEQIGRILASDFIFVPLYVDDKTEIEAYEAGNEACLSSPLVHTIGERNLVLQCNRFFDGEGFLLQPLLVSVDENGQVLGRIELTEFIRGNKELINELKMLLQK